MNEVVDLGSGSGVEELHACGFKKNVTLTDLYPNVGGSLPYWSEPVDAAAVPDTLSGVRIIFASFHHFRPQAAREILRDAFKRRRPIAIFEATSRTLAAIASALAVPILALVLTPRIRPLSWTQVLFTSQLSTYSAPELEELTRDLQSAGISLASRIVPDHKAEVRAKYRSRLGESAHNAVNSASALFLEV